MKILSICGCRNPIWDGLILGISCTSVGVHVRVIYANGLEGRPGIPRQAGEVRHGLCPYRLRYNLKSQAPILQPCGGNSHRSCDAQSELEIPSAWARPDTQACFGGVGSTESGRFHGLSAAASQRGGVAQLKAKLLPTHPLTRASGSHDTARSVHLARRQIPSLAGPAGRWVLGSVATLVPNHLPLCHGVPAQAWC